MNLLNKFFSYRSIQTVILISLGFLFLYFGLTSLFKRIGWCDGYALGDWLITYEDGGFKRRGLSGSILIFLSRFSGIYVSKILLSFLCFIYLIFIVLFIDLFRKVNWNFSFIIYFLLPTTFFFSINDFYVFGRKEILFFLLILIFVWSYNRINIYSWKYVVSLSSVLSFLTLLHELVVFFTSYFLFIYFLDFLYKKKGSLFKIFVLGCSTFVPALLIFLFGAEINEGKSWEIFKHLGVGPNVMNGILSWPKEGFGQGKINALEFAKSHHYERYIIPYIITMLSLVYMVIKNIGVNKKSFKLILCLILFQALSFPIFFLTIDWGRWLNIHFMSILLFSLLFMKSNNNYQISFRQFILLLKKPTFIFKILIIIVLMFGFSMEHVEEGFVIGQNQLLINIRDLFWQIRHLKF